MKLVIATTNAGKLREMRALLPDVWDVRSLADFPPLQMPAEDGATMRENARLKAVHCAAHFKLPCLADDSGIEVDALHGAPGVHSARWVAGTDAERSAALLARLQNVPDDDRTARFRCALCLAGADENCLEVEATCEGKIATAPRGDNGFGYDPIFEITRQTGAAPHQIGKTMAEVPTVEKGKLSHRARAVELLLHRLAEQGVL